MPKNLTKFTKDQDETLIELVRTCDILYDSRRKDYKNKVMKDNHWEDISEAIKSTVPECKKRWKSLRDLYQKKRKAEFCGTNSAQKEETWEYMPYMSFLSNVPSEYRQTLQPDSQASEPHVILTEENRYNDATDSESGKESVTAVTTRNYGVLKRSADENSDIEFAEKRVKQSATDNTNAARTAIMTFFESMALTVDTFPPDLAAEVKMNVCRIVTDAEMRLVSRKQNHQ